MRIVVKPLEAVHRVVQIRTTQVESALWEPFPWLAAPERTKTSQLMWHVFGDIVNSAAFSLEKGKRLNQMHLEKCRRMAWMQDSSKKDLQFFMNKLESEEFVEIGQSYEDVVGCELSMWIWIECGKFLVWFSGTADMVMSDGSVVDLKHYAAKWTKEVIEEYNLDNYKETCLADKIQWFMYPLMWNEKTEWDISFEYHIYTKHKTTQLQVLKCRVDVAKAIEKVKEMMVEFFRVVDIESLSFMDCNDSVYAPQ